MPNPKTPAWDCKCGCPDYREHCRRNPWNSETGNWTEKNGAYIWTPKKASK